MKKLLLLAASVILTATVAMAQYQTTAPSAGIGGGSTPGTAVTVGSQGATNSATGSSSTATFSGNVTGVLNYIPNYDVMGAHENGGRGCAGCHAPHNGAKGAGGSLVQTGTNAYVQGGLWGTDTSLILSTYSGSGITFNGGNSHHSGVLTINATASWSDPVYTGVVTCLSCHDGNVSTGAMMSGVSYEQQFGLLNGVGVGINTARNVGGSNATSVQLYGSAPIPTFLGTGGSNPGGAYGGQHPVGQTASMTAALGSVLTNANYGMSVAILGNSLNIAAVPASSPFGNFIATYYPGALMSTANAGTGFGNSFVTCTTCHNQHNMAVYGGGQRNETVPAGVVQVRTIFFVNGGYNPGAPYDSTHEPSTMRFCQQCHFSFSSEYFGATNVGTAY